MVWSPRGRGARVPRLDDGGCVLPGGAEEEASFKLVITAERGGVFAVGLS